MRQALVRVRPLWFRATRVSPVCASHSRHIPLVPLSPVTHCCCFSLALHFSPASLVPQLNWTGGCRLIGTGTSILRRSCLGATQCLEAMSLETLEESRVEELARLAAETERFTGTSFRIGDNGLTSRVEPSPAYATLASTRATAAMNRSCREYGSNATEVAVPFVLTGDVCLKTGVIRLVKTHLRYVYNSITYSGLLSVFCHTPDGREQSVHALELMHTLERLNRGDASAVPIGVRIRCNSEYSMATISLVPTTFAPNVAAVQPQTAAVAAEAARQPQTSEVEPAVQLPPRTRAPINAASGRSHSVSLSIRLPPIVALDAPSSPAESEGSESASSGGAASPSTPSSISQGVECAADSPVPPSSESELDSSLPVVLEAIIAPTPVLRPSVKRGPILDVTKSAPSVYRRLCRAAQSIVACASPTVDLATATAVAPPMQQ